VPLRDLFERVYFRMERTLAPDVRYAQWAYEEALGDYVLPGVAWLDLGCGRRLLPPWRAARERELVGRCRQLVGVDLDLPSLIDNLSLSLRAMSSATELPFADGTFDIVTANMVVEHLPDPEHAFREIARVLAPGGLLVFHTPNAGAYPTAVAAAIPDGAKRLLARALEGRLADDVFPTFYRANSQSAITALGNATGFDVVALRLVSSGAVFARVPPLAFIELLWLRYLSSPARADRRSNIIAILRKR
jgi:SAM-dependent methyltransferase